MRFVPASLLSAWALALAAPLQARPQDAGAGTEPAAVPARRPDPKLTMAPAALPVQAFTLEAAYTLDAAAAVEGGSERGARLLGNLDLIARFDLDRGLGWRGGRALLYVLGNHGGDPNDLAGTAGGIDNIAVTDGRLKLYEAWIEQEFAGGGTSLLAGLWDLNSEFYATAASDLLIGPPFGIGSELAATGPNGPSIFPSTALAVRLRTKLAEAGYVQAAVVNARAGTIGDPGGVDRDFGDGVLGIVEGGVAGDRKLALGLWRYSERQPVAGSPGRRDVAQGTYLLAEGRLAGTFQRRLDGFLRLGISDGRTMRFRGGWQAGVLASGVFPAVPKSLFSFGVRQDWLASAPRGGTRAASFPDRETAFEATLAYPVGETVPVQPSVQYILNPADAPSARDALVLGLRIVLAPPLP